LARRWACPEAQAAITVTESRDLDALEVGSAIARKTASDLKRLAFEIADARYLNGANRLRSEIAPCPWLAVIEVFPSDHTHRRLLAPRWDNGVRPISLTQPPAEVHASVNVC